jgi:HK97 family phage portal protein
MKTKTTTTKAKPRKRATKALSQTKPAEPNSTTTRIFFLPQRTAGVRVTEETALTLGAVWACVRVITESLAGLPWLVYRKRRDGGNDLQYDHQLNWLLDTQPNPETTAFTFRETLIAHALTWGNCYAEIERDAAGRPVWLWQITPDRVDVIRWRGRIIYDVANPRGPNIPLERDEMFHVPGLGFDGLIGYSVIRMAARAIGVGIGLEESGSGYFANDSTPGGVLIHPGKLTKEARDNIQNSWQKRHGGPNNRRVIAVLEEDMKWQQTGLPPEDSQFVEQKQLTPTEIARWFRVPPHKIGDLTRCMPASTLVYTTAGPKRIADVEIGDEVWSVGANGIEPAPVVGCYDNGVRSLLEIATTNRTVRCTPNHRLLVRRPTFRPLNPGERGGRNIDGQKVRVEWKNAYVQAGELSEGDMLVTLESLPESASTTAPNGRELSVEFMEFCGLLLGDGNIHRAKGKPGHVSIARSGSATYMEHYREASRSEFRSYVANSNYSNLATVSTKPVHLYETERATHFASVLAAGELTDLGFSGTAFTKRVPAWVYSAAKPLQLALLRGFLDADGTVDHKGRITFYSASKALIDDVRHLCMGLGIPVTNVRSDVNSKPAPASKQLVPTRMWRFTCSDTGANRRIGSHDARYIARFEAGKPFARKDRKYPRFGGRNDLNGLATAKIVRITNLPAEPTYDIEVAGNHSFLADGVASHNSTNNNIEHQSIEFVEDTLRPWAERFESEANIRLFGRNNAGTLHTIIDLDERMRGDSAARAAFYGPLLDRGVFSINDVLVRENKNPIGPDGDKRFVALNMQLLENAGEEPPPGQEPPTEPASDELRTRIESAGLDVLRDAVRRVLKREEHEARRQLKAGKPYEKWSGKFLAEHRDYMREILLPPLRLLEQCYGGAASAEVSLAVYLDKHLEGFAAFAAEPVEQDPLKHADDLRRCVQAAAAVQGAA